MSFVFEGNSFCGEPIVPEIGENGNWHVNNVDTGKPSRGMQGVKGDTGLAGAKGEKGIQGADGTNGVDGITPNISIGTVTTLESNQQATVSRTGTDEAPIFNFGIPKGIQGESVDKTLTLIESTSNITLTTKPYQYISATMDINFTLPTIEENDKKIHEIHLYYYSDTAYSVYFSDIIAWQNTLTVEANKMIELTFTHINGVWLGREVIYNIPE